MTCEVFAIVKIRFNDCYSSLDFSTRNGQSVKLFSFDSDGNCAIYHCIHAPSTRLVCRFYFVKSSQQCLKEKISASHRKRKIARENSWIAVITTVIHEVNRSFSIGTVFIQPAYKSCIACRLKCNNIYWILTLFYTCFAVATLSPCTSIPNASDNRLAGVELYSFPRYKKTKTKNRS